MATSSNPAIQKVMDEISGLDPQAEGTAQRLQELVEKVAKLKREEKEGPSNVNFSGPTDPQDAFQCDGCQ